MFGQRSVKEAIKAYCGSPDELEGIGYVKTVDYLIHSLSKKYQPNPDKSITECQSITAKSIPIDRIYIQNKRYFDFVDMKPSAGAVCVVEKVLSQYRLVDGYESLAWAISQESDLSHQGSRLIRVLILHPMKEIRKHGA